jgi:hypothetical protein
MGEDRKRRSLSVPVADAHLLKGKDIRGCLHIVEEGIPLSVRIWQCPQCKIIHIRDENAAINGLLKALWDLLQKNEVLTSLVSCSDLVSVKERWAWCVSPSGVVSTLRGQSSEIFAAPGNLNESVIALDQKLFI